MRPTPARRTATAVAVLLVSSPLLGFDCGGGGGGGAGGGGEGSTPPATYRADARILWDAAEQPSPNVTQYRDLQVLDVARLGTTVAVLVQLRAQGVGGTSPNPVCPLTCPPVNSPGAVTDGQRLYVSHDDGATWDEPIGVAWPVGQLVPRPSAVGVMLASGVSTGVRAWLVGEYFPDSVLSTTAWRRTIREFSLSSTAFIANPTVDDVVFSDKLVQRGTKAWDFEAFSYGSGSSFSSTLVWSILDLSTGVLQHGGANAQTSFHYPWSWGTQNGSSWTAAQPEGGQLCVYRVTPATALTPSKACTVAATFPASLVQGDLETLPFPSSRGLVLLAQQARSGDAHVTGATLDTLTGFDLGPGDPPYFTPIHPPFGLAVRVSGSASKVYDLTAAGIDEVSYPATPCTDTCGQGAFFAWAQPLASGKHLALYVVDTGKFGSQGQRLTTHPVLVALTVTPTRAPLGGSPGLAAAAAPGFLNACTAMSSCFGTRRQRCADAFLHAPFYGPRSDLLLKYNQGCTVLAGIWPDAALPGKSGCVQGCQGNVAVTCAAGTVATATDCARYMATCGTPGGVLACSDGSPSLACDTCSANGSAVTCAEPVPTALVCSQYTTSCLLGASGPSCALGGTCAPGAAPICSGDLLQQCRDGYYRSTACNDLGLTCSADGAGACVPKTTTAACASGTFAETCDGTKAVYCSGGALLATDCARIGFSRCVVTDGEARCAP